MRLLRWCVLALVWLGLTGTTVVKCSSGSSIHRPDEPKPNDPPIAFDGALSAVQNVAVTGALDAMDANGDQLAFSIVTAPRLGIVELVDPATGAFRYTAQLPGADRFEFLASDGTADSNVGVVAIDVATSLLVWHP